MAPLTAGSAAALLTKSRYDPAIAPQLEEYVQTQCKNQTYDVDANLALLKLYQFTPEKANASVVARVLALSLMRMPAPDYLQGTYLLSEALHESPLVAALADVAALLETGAFQKVWALITPLKPELLQHVPGFDDGLRRFILDVMAVTYQAIPESHVRESLHVDAAQLKSLLDARGWKLEDAIVKVTLNADNTAKPKRPDESGFLRHDQMTKILASVGTVP